MNFNCDGVFFANDLVKPLYGNFSDFAYVLQFKLGEVVQSSQDFVSSAPIRDDRAPPPVHSSSYSLAPCRSYSQIEHARSRR